LFWDNSGLYQFDLNGNYIRSIGQKLQGPGDFGNNINDFLIDRNKKEIIINALNVFKLIHYDLDGNFLYEDYRAEAGNEINDSILWTFHIGHYMDKYLFAARKANVIKKTTADIVADTLLAIPNQHYDYKPLNFYMLTGASRINCYYSYKDDFFYKGWEDIDTVFKISGLSVEKYAIINLGKYKMPEQYLPTDNSLGDKKLKYGDKYLRVSEIREDDNYFFMFISDQQGMSSEQDKYVLYAKNQRSGFIVNDKGAKGITDDINGGPSFWPRQITDDYYIDYIEWHDLLDRVEKENCKPSPRLQAQLDKLGEDTNQLIVLARKKKGK